MTRFRPRLGTLIALGVLFTMIAVKAADVRILSLLQLQVFDQFQAWSPREYTTQPIRIIDIDDESLKKLGQWPWPRTILADLVRTLNDAGAAAVVLDMVFAEPDRTSPKTMLHLWRTSPDVTRTLATLPDHDAVLAQAFAESNVVTGFILAEGGGANTDIQVKAGFSHAGGDPRGQVPYYPTAVGALPELQQAAGGNGALNSTPDADGILRRIPLILQAGDALYPTLTAEALRLAQGASTFITRMEGGNLTHIKVGDVEIPTDGDGQLWVYYTAEAPERYIPAWKVLLSEWNAGDVEGAIVLVGTSAAGLKDIRTTPLNPAAPGVEVHAQALEQILAGIFLTRPDWMLGAETIAMLLGGLVMIGLMKRSSAEWGALAAVVLVGGAIWLSYRAFTVNQVLVDPVMPALTFLALHATLSFARFVTAEREKRAIRSAFAHYMSPALVDKLARNPAALTLGGETRCLSVLFSDIRGFTGISEALDAQSLTSLLNRYLTPMTSIVMSHQGTIDKYIGDAIMAFWNAPLDDPHHAENACRAALAMREALAVLNDQLHTEAEARNEPFKALKIGIGINTGEASVGNMGSEQRFDYTVLGDNVNLASRLEGQSKTYGVDIILGEETARAATMFATMEIDWIRVKGRNRPEPIYLLLGDEALKVEPAFQDFRLAFADMLSAYRSGAWEKARHQLTLAKSALPSYLYTIAEPLLETFSRRIAHAIAYPPKEWSGVYEATEK